mgnify:FL=1
MSIERQFAITTSSMTHHHPLVYLFFLKTDFSGCFSFSAMIGKPYRQDPIYKLCVLCTIFMFVTSVLNLYYLYRRSKVDSIEENRVQTMQTFIVTSKTDAVDKQIDIIANENNDFEQTYRQLSSSFERNIISLAQNRAELLQCPAIPPDLLGPNHIQPLPSNFSLLTPSVHHPNVLFGGRFRPTTCHARHKIALLVPYRDRYEILKHFLYHTHQFLQRQQLDYRIYICEQAYNKIFNKGIVMNGCFKEILKVEPDTPCFIMHDVDLLLIDDRNMYTCPPFPRHLSVAIDKFHFYLPYTGLVGGVLAMRREHYVLVNGYSTNYWGWGGEDDDMYERIVSKRLVLERPPRAIARYKMLKHTHQKLNPARMKVLRTAHIRIDSDGVNNVQYKLLNMTLYPLYTHFLIDVGEQKV